jgi:DNA modification methylase
MNYQEFLKSKMILENRTGFEIQDHEVNQMLKPHQKDITRWSVSGGCRAIFAAFGLGKSFMQLEILRLILKYVGGNGLIICPLGVRQEFKIDAAKLGIEITFVRRTEEVTALGMYITNYESVRDGRLDPDIFTAVSLDEASVLRSYGSKTYQEFLTLFKKVKYRFVATATPSPNRYKELIHYAGFLGIMDTGQALTRFFQRDSQKAGNLTLYPHKEKEFWFWVNSWAIFLQKPSDLGHSDEGYDLPALHVHLHEVQTELEFRKERSGQMNMFGGNAALSLQDASREKRRSLDIRTEKMVEILAARPQDHFVIWHDQEIERHAIKKAVPGVAEVFGSLDLEIREQRIVDFSEGKIKDLATKPILSGSGCNFQRHCNNAIYLGIGFKFNDFIQSVHRIYRFLQTKECHIHLIYTDTEKQVLKVLMEKWQRHKEMVQVMSEIIKEHGLSTLRMAGELARSIGCERVEVSGKNYTAVNNDCIEETRLMETNSVDLIHTSIPFSNHYEYSPSYNDFGHNTSNDTFFQQMDFLTPELLRVLAPGRIAAIHVKDRIQFGTVTGYGMPSVDPFHSTCISHYRKHGFIYCGMITVVTDVVRENNQTYRLGWTEQCKDGSKMGVGTPEYILIFRKLPTETSTAYADERVVKDKTNYSRSRWQIDAHSFWRSSGDRLLSVDELKQYPVDVIRKTFRKHLFENIYDYEAHVKFGERLDETGALPSTFMLLDPPSHNTDVWDDVVRMRTLNGNQKQKGLNNHICPLQIDIVDRIINRYSNIGDVVYDPFAGLMTVPFRAVELRRYGRGCELNSAYFTDGLTYLNQADRQVSMPTLFDLEAAA